MMGDIQSEKLNCYLFFIIFLILGIFIFRDYGISTDELQQRAIGLTSLYFLATLFQVKSLLDPANTLIHPEEYFLKQHDRDYGVAFELPVEFFIKLLNIQSNIEIIYFRHFATFFTFFIATYFFYKLIKNRFNSSTWGLIGSLCLILSPRIFADSFYNCKDLVFLSAYIIATYAISRVIVENNYKSILLCAFACSLAIDVRIMGTLLPITAAAVLLLIHIKSTSRFRIFSVQLTFFCLSVGLFVILMWPWLWLNPWEHFLLAFKNMSKFRHSVDLIFMGNIINSKNVPWFYIPIWVCITTPPIYIVFFIYGTITSAFLLIKKNIFKLDKPQLIDLTVLILFFAPIFSVIYFKSVLYNGWRQLYFIYPAFLYIAIFGAYTAFNKISKNIIARKIFIAIAIISLCNTGIWMIRFHPNQFLYFNILAHNWEKNFDLDYWGVAYRQPVEKIFLVEDGKLRWVYSELKYWQYWQLPIWTSLTLLDPNKQALFMGGRSEECSDYVIKTELKGAKHYETMSGYSLLDRVMIDNRLIYATYKRNIPLDDAFPLKSNSDIAFRKDLNGRCFLGDGWSATPEEWGIWSIGKLVKLDLRVPKDEPKYLTLDLRAFVTKTFPSQKIIVSINNRELSAMTLNSFEKNIIKIPLTKQEQAAKNLEISIHLPDAISPKKLGVSDDNRELGVGLKSLRFEN